MSAEAILAVVGAVAGVGGAGVALAALRDNRHLTAQSDRIQERLAAIEEERRADELADQRREQAELVSSWLEYRMLSDPEIPGYEESTQVVVVKNASDLPIRNVSMWDRTRPDTKVVHTYRDRIDTIAPHETGWRTWRSIKRDEPDPRPVIDFTDAQGVVWHRDDTGLHEGPSRLSGEGDKRLTP
jgi:hypothetical protein